MSLIKLEHELPVDVAHPSDIFRSNMPLIETKVKSIFSNFLGTDFRFGRLDCLVCLDARQIHLNGEKIMGTRIGNFDSSIYETGAINVDEKKRCRYILTEII